MPPRSLLLVVPLLAALLAPPIAGTQASTPVASPAPAPIAHAWPMWGGNPARTRAMPGSGPEGEPVSLWTFPPAGTPNPHASVDRGALADGVLYLPTVTGAIIAIDAATGRELWRATGYGNTIVVDGDGLIVHGNPISGDGGDLARIRRADGSPVWTAEPGKIRAAWNPVVADGVGYTPSGGDFIAFDPATGDVLWRLPLNAPASRGASVADGLAVLGDERGLVYGVSTAGGDVVWTHQTDATTIGHPTLANGTAYVNLFQGPTRAYLALDAATGAPKWHYDSPSGAPFLTPAVDETSLYLPGDDGTLYALDAATGALRWSFRTGPGAAISPALVGGTLYLAAESGFALALDPATGAERWRFRLDASGDSAAMVVDGVFYLSTTLGTVYAIGGSASPAP
jgi:outer membrane protein assembly factor BamB